VFKLTTDGTSFVTLHNFTGGADGANPYALLLLSGNTLFGTTVGGGTSSTGAVFSVNTDGTGFTTLHSFTGASDGAAPYGGLILSGNTLYGTTSSGGSLGYGTVFKVNTNGTGFSILHTFTGPGGGADPLAGLVLAGNTLYGTTGAGGVIGRGSSTGTVFKVNTDGTGFTLLYMLTGLSGYSSHGELALSGNTLYGTTIGAYRILSTVFKLNNDGTGFTNVHAFSGASDGVSPYAGLTLSGNTLYGTAAAGGVLAGGGAAYGTVFAVSTDGTGSTTLHTFAGGSDGAYPHSSLVLSGNTLYGTTDGTVFSLSFAPQLTITASGGDAVLSWPTDYVGFNYAGYSLQSATDLGPGAVWSPVATAPVAVTDQFVVTVPASGAQQFYRLSQ
jgi:uncharacterized repeat protein (TIGR03803 family)